MNYPKEILPNPYRKLFECSFNKHKVIRAIKASELYPTPVDRNDIRDPQTNQIKERYVCSPSHQIIDLSVSLYGIFNAKHNEIELVDSGKTSYNHYCQPDDLVVPPSFKDHFTMISRFYWWMDAEKLHLREIPLIVSGIEYKVRCHIIHSPMRWNFWHFSFNWEIVGVGFLHQLEENLRKKFSEKIKKLGKAQVIMLAQWSDLEPFELEKSSYCKNFLSRISIWFNLNLRRLPTYLQNQ